MSTDARKVASRHVVALAFVLATALSSPAPAAPLAIGTVEKFEEKTTSIVVLGQRYSVGSATLTAGTKSYPASKGLRLLSPDAVLWVDGELKKDGTTTVRSLTVLPERNTPGATQVFVAGVVKSVDRTGRLKIGTLTVDITPTLGTADFNVRAGDAVEVFGVQPVPGGVLVASAIAPIRPHASTTGVGGTGIAGVGGTGVAGVGGTGTAGVGGTGLAGVGGTGTAGVGGTGMAGVGGTGTAGVGGTGLAGVGGTGTAGVGGTGLAGVGGTGTAGVGGTGMAGVGGTGTAGVGGTGLAGVGGTGTAGVGGTGLAGVGGTGTAGVGGTGLAGVGGTGAY